MKIKLFIFSICLIFISCAKEENTTTNIPYAQVEIDINILLKNKFKNSYYHETFESGNKTGYAGVVAISDKDASTIHAFDLCCPYEAPEKNKIVIKQWDLTGKCPKCSSVFSLADGSGSVISGVATTRLKGYRVILDGNKYMIRN